MLKHSPDLTVVLSLQPVICSVLGKHVNFVSAYAPNNPSSRREFYQDILPNYFEASIPSILAGDFNCVESLSMDRLAHSQGSLNSLGSQELDSCLREFGMVHSKFPQT